MPTSTIPSSLRILQVLPALESGGVERGTIDFALFLKKLKHEPLVASKSGALVSLLEEADVPHLTLNLASKNPFNIIKNAFALKKIIKEQGIHIVHARSRAPAWSAYFACKMTKCQFVTTFHGTYNFKAPFKRWYNSVMVRGKRVIAISPFIQRHIEQNYSKWLEEHSLRLVERGVDLTDFNPQKTTVKAVKAMRESWDVPITSTVILMPARLTRWKGQLTALEALKIVKETHSQVALVLVGSAQGRVQYRQELDSYVLQNKLTQNVRFKEHTHDIQTAYKASDIVLHASTDPEAFGRVIIEAQAMLKPVIASRLGAPIDIIEEGRTGWLHNPGDAQDLAQTILKVFETKRPTAQKITDAAATNVHSLYDARITHEKTLAVYFEVLKNA